MIKVVTIEREYGCGGGEIARKLADRLGWKLWDQLLTCEIARLADCERGEVECREEKVDPLYYRLFKSILRGSYEGSHGAHGLKLVDAESIRRISSEVILKVAETGNSVIVGRGSQHFLKDRSDTLRLFLYAPREDKVRRLRAQGIAENEVEELVDTVDHERAAYIQKYFNAEWPGRSLYHAMLNTAVGEETVIDEILDLKATLESEPSAVPAAARPAR